MQNVGSISHWDEPGNGDLLKLQQCNLSVPSAWRNIYSVDVDKKK